MMFLRSYYISNQWLRHYTCSGFCKTSYHLLISPPPTNLPNTLKIHTGENKVDRKSRMWRQYTCYFPANGSTNPDVFQPKTFQSQGKSSLKVSARQGSPFWRCQGTNKQAHSLTDRLVLLQRDFESAIFYNQYVRSIYVNEYQYKPVSDTQTYVTYASTTLNSFNSVSDTQTSKNYIL